MSQTRWSRGARSACRAYAWAILAGSAVAAFAQSLLHHWLRLPTRYDGPGIPNEVIIMQPAAVFFEGLIWASIIVFIYVNRRSALAESARVSTAQVEHARARRSVLESRLQALQARVEPQFLFNTLAKVRDLYNDNSEKGGRLLEDLIVYLRAALPGLRDSTSTLEQELKLVAAYLSIVRAHLGDRFTVDIDAPHMPALGAVAVPPMMLLPLVDHVLDAVSASPGAHRVIRVAARATSGRLRVEIGATGGNLVAGVSQDIMLEIRDRLRALYADGGMLDLESSNALGVRVVMEIPYESADGNHR